MEPDFVKNEEASERWPRAAGLGSLPWGIPAHPIASHSCSRLGQGLVSDVHSLKHPDCNCKKLMHSLQGDLTLRWLKVDFHTPPALGAPSAGNDLVPGYHLVKLASGNEERSALQHPGSDFISAECFSRPGMQEYLRQGKEAIFARKGCWASRWRRNAEELLGDCRKNVWIERKFFFMGYIDNTHFFRLVCRNGFFSHCKSKLIVLEVFLNLVWSLQDGVWNSMQCSFTEIGNSTRDFGT